MFDKDLVSVNYIEDFAVLRAVYSRIEDEGNANIFRSSEEIDGEYSFAGCMQADYNHFYLISYDSVITGCIWLNRFMGNSCFVHFCGFDCGDRRRYAVKIGRYLVDDWLLKYHYKVLFGAIPSSERRLRLFIRKLFFKRACIVPKLFYIPTEEKDVDFDIWYKTVDDLKREI